LDSDSQGVDDSDVSDNDSVDVNDCSVDNQSDLNSFSRLSDSKDLFVDGYLDLSQDFVSLFDDQLNLLFHGWAGLNNFLFQDLDFDGDVVLLDNMFDVFLHDNLKLDNFSLGFLGFNLHHFNLLL
jgi:hypothetical protein